MKDTLKDFSESRRSDPGDHGDAYENTSPVPEDTSQIRQKR